MRFGRHENEHMTDILFTLALFCVFAASALLVILIGADVYQSLVSDMQDNYNSRTALSYVTEKIHQHDEAGSVDVCNIQGTAALVLYDEQNGSEYATYIYNADGKIKELYINTEEIPSVEAGRDIMDSDGFEIEKINDTLFYLKAEESDGNVNETYVSLRSGEGGM